MRKLLAWLLVTLGIAALVRRLRRRQAAEPSHVEAPAPVGDDPANELRRKLDESRSTESSAAGGSEAPSSAEVDDRRADVHAEGRAALDEMRSVSDETS